MAQLTGVSREEVSTVLSSFAVNVEQQTSLGVGTDDYIRKVLIAALGPEKATAVIERILSGRSSRGLEALKWMEPRAVAGMLRHEHPQIIAIVLSYLESDQAAQVLMQLPESARADVLMRVATLDGVHPNALNELDEVLEKQFASTSSGNSNAGFGGPKAAAEILNLVGSAQEGPLIAEIAKTDEALSQKLQDLMFVFEDLIEVDDRGMQELLREVPGDKLIIALKAADEGLKTEVLQEHVRARSPDDEGRPGGARTGATLGGRGGAEGDPGHGAAHGRRGPPGAGRQRRGDLCLSPPPGSCRRSTARCCRCAAATPTSR